jgi:bifunctional non-homologous end joining protein LigD
MALEEYRKKRDFSKTPEPGPGKGERHRRPIFVVQEHHATRLHYDFRLEADGVLKSWAVPKEPSLDPSQKRLAVHVEDHPLSYAGFHGTIPEGHYGAGEVHIWDRGTYESALPGKSVAEGIAEGKVEFTLHGKKLNGRFVLERMRGKGRGKENWLLIKSSDEFARRESLTNGEKKETSRRSSKPHTARRSAGPAVTRSTSVLAEGVTFTNLDKLMYPDAGITKADVIDYYRRIAPRLLPHLKDRPVTLERLPDGLDGEHFWQKNTPASYPDWIAKVDLPSEAGKPVRYALVNDEETLLYLVNQGALTLHVWLSRVEDLDHPDFVLFDLDRGEAAFTDVVAVARELHEILEGDGRPAFVKTSGKTGLHVLVGWTQRDGYTEARNWALEIAERVVAALPETATTERSKAKRNGRVYVDVMQNARGKHVVPPYVLRPIPGAPVSTPLSWRELSAQLEPARFNLKTIFRRLARQQHDPMAGLLDSAARA